MLLDLGAVRAESRDVPAAWRPLVSPAGDGFCLIGDRTAATELFLYVRDGHVLVADCRDELLDHLAERALNLSLSRFGLSALLQRGLIPLPHTEFDGISLLTMGDTVRVTWDQTRVETDLSADYPWFTGGSREDGTPDEGKLLSLLTAATARDLAASGGDGLLMLSSGMDSVSLALAIAEAGYSDIPCATYSSGPDDPEPPVAADVCKRLGLEHRVVELPSDPDRVRATLTSFFTEAAGAGTDLAQIPFVLATAAAGSPGGVVVAGDGNDSYMGSLVKRRRRMKAVFRIRGRRLAGAAHRLTPVDSPLNYVARSRLEAGLPGRMMRFHESRALLPDAIDTSAFWWQLSKQSERMSMFDAYSVLDKHFTVPSSMKKHVLAARAIGCETSLPWCDHEIADYYFNLPVEYRYDERTSKNKILLRRMLLRFLDYDADNIGSKHFAFDGARFVAENEDFVRTEIGECALWNRDGVRMAHNWIDSIGNRPFLYHPILSVFMVSGWLNHSRFLARSSPLAEAPRD